MIYSSFFLYFILVHNVGNAMKYITNFKFEEIVFGKEHLMKDYVTLANDPNGNLPNSYTVCSSVYVKFCTSNYGVLTMLKNDGSPWYLVEIFTTSRQYETKSEKISLWYENPSTGKTLREDFSDAHIPIVPHSWYHVCMGLDTVSGLLRIVVNGRLVVSEEKDYFRGTTHWKPASVQGNILQFKGYMSGFWYLHRSTFSNFNIFNSVMSVEDMETRTSGGDTCSTPGDYLRCFSIL